MKNLFKAIAILALSATVVVSTIGCGGDEKTKNDTNADVPAVETDAETDEPADEPVDEPADEPVEEPADEPEEEPAEEPEEEPADEPEEVESDVDGEVVYDDGGVKIVYTGYEEDEYWADSLNFYIENNSDKAVTISADNVVVNDYMTSEIMLFDVEAGKKLNDSISLLDDDFGDTVGKVEVFFEIYDSDTYETIADDLYFALEFDEEVEKLEAEGEEIYNKDGLKILCLGLEEDDFFGHELCFYIENNSDNDYYVSNDTFSMFINDFEVSALFGENVLAGKAAFTEITIFDSDLEDNNIDAIETIEVDLVVEDYETFEVVDQFTYTYTA